MKKIIASGIAAILAVSMLSSCKFNFKKGEEVVESPEEIALKAEVKQNDYRGGVIRTQALQKQVLDVMENMKQNNVTIRENNPNSFWSQDGYQDFVVNFLNSPVINDTQWFSEEEKADWTETLGMISSYENNFTEFDSKNNVYVLKNGVRITRNEKDDYTATNSWYDILNKTEYSFNLTYRILYDCDKDWCKTYATAPIAAGIPDSTLQLFEYARIDNNTFAIQTNKERLVVVLEDAVEDTDIRERKLKEFYYSKLTNDGERTTFDPYQRRYETDEDGNYKESAAALNSLMAAYPFVNEKGDLNTYYGKNDSMFMTEDIVRTVNGDWVFEDRSLQQAIVYKEGALVVVTYNKLSENYERFIYTMEGVPDSRVFELQDMVQIKDLVGIHKNDAETSEDTEAGSENPEETTSSASEETPAKDSSSAASTASTTDSSSQAESVGTDSQTDESSIADSLPESSDGSSEGESSSEESSSESNENSSSETEEGSSSELTPEEIEEMRRKLAEYENQ